MSHHRMRERRKRRQELVWFQDLVAKDHQEAHFLDAVRDGATIVTAPGRVADELVAAGLPAHRLSISRYAPPGYLFAIDPAFGDLVPNEPFFRIYGL
jgi:hypothetical protein